MQETESRSGEQGEPTLASAIKLNVAVQRRNEPIKKHIESGKRPVFRCWHRRGQGAARGRKSRWLSPSRVPSYSTEPNRTGPAPGLVPPGPAAQADRLAAIPPGCLPAVAADPNRALADLSGFVEAIGGREQPSALGLRDSEIREAAAAITERGTGGGGRDSSWFGDAVDFEFGSQQSVALQRAQMLASQQPTSCTRACSSTAGDIPAHLPWNGSPYVCEELLAFRVRPGRGDPGPHFLSSLFKRKINERRHPIAAGENGVVHLPFRAASVLAVLAVAMAASAPESAGGPRLRLSLTAANICHPDKTDCDGEDAFAVRDDGRRQVFAVADGVSGSRKFGDPADFSRSLLYQTLANPDLHKDPRGAVDSALNTVRSAGKKGSTTLLSIWPHCIHFFFVGRAFVHRTVDSPHQMRLNSSATDAMTVGIYDSEQSAPVLHLFNLGDSQAMLFRPRNRTGPFQHLAQTEQQLHDRDILNIPYQFHHAGPQSCSVSEMEVYHWKLQPGDVVIAATDGLTDFLDAEDINATIEDHRRDLKHVASVLVNKARAEQNFSGRFDDISVIVAYANESKASASKGLDLDNFGARK